MNGLKWRKSSYSTGEGNGNDCVEVAPLPGGGWGIRDSKAGEDGDVLELRPEAFTAFRTAATTT